MNGGLAIAVPLELAGFWLECTQGTEAYPWLTWCTLQWCFSVLLTAIRTFLIGISVIVIEQSQWMQGLPVRL